MVDYSLQFISHTTERYGYLDSIRMALEGGCRWVQLRMKGATVDEMRPVAIEAQRLCSQHDATFVIDDQVALVKEIGADGVHLGKNDMPIAEARRLLGSEFIIGGTANTFDDIVSHHRSGADYIGCGPFRFTTTKQGLSPILGLEGYRHIVEQMRQHEMDLPIVAIGGITVADIPEVMATGVTGIALSGAILGAPDPVEATREVVRVLRNSK